MNGHLGIEMHCNDLVSLDALGVLMSINAGGVVT